MIGRHQQIGKIFWTFTLSTGADAFPTFDSHSRSFSLRVNESLYRCLTLAGLVSHCILIAICFLLCVSPGQWDWRQPANWIRRVSEVLCLSEGSWAYNWSVYFRPAQKYSKVDPWIMCGYVPFFWHLACCKVYYKKAPEGKQRERLRNNSSLDKRHTKAPVLVCYLYKAGIWSTHSCQVEFLYASCGQQA